MTTFLLKKYDDTTPSPNNETKEENTTDNKELSIKVEGSVAEVIASALNKVLANKAEIVQVDDETAETSIKTLSTEDINEDPIKSFNSIQSNDVVFIDTHNKGFTTAKEDWFLLNLPNKTSNVFYSVESLIKYVTTKLGV